MHKMFNVKMTEEQLQVCMKYVGISADQITVCELSTSDPKHPVNKAWVMEDPEINAAPGGGESLLVIQQGGVLISAPWQKGFLSWAYKPSIPKSVKDRMYGRA